MSNRLIAALIVLAGATGQTATPAKAGCTPAPDVTATPFDRAFIAAMQQHRVPGAAVAIVHAGGQQVLAGYGCADIDAGTAVDPVRTVFHVASVSKPFVALDTVQLAASGTLDLHEDVNRYVRGLEVPSGWGAPVTLHHLLTHTAGFDESVVGYAARTASDLRPLGEFLAAKLPRRGWAPGDLLSYSNYGYALAGYVVESVAGMPFHEHVRRTVLSPLGMTRSSFEQPMPAELQPDAAVAYRCTMERCISLPPDFRSAYPPGGLVTTAADMSRFLLAQLDSTDDPSPLTEEVRRFMHERQFSHDPALPGLTYGFAEDELAGERALSHAGGASGFSSFVVLVPAKRFGAFLAVNGGGSGFGADVMNLMAEQFLSPSGPALVAPTFAGHVDAPSPVGAYRSTRYAHRGVENLPTLFSGQLHARGTATELNIDGLGSASGTYLRVGPGLWRKAGGTELVGVRTNGRHTTHLFGAPSFFGTRYPAAFERLTWYDEPSLVNEELSYLVMMPLLALAGWPLIVGTQWLVRRWRGGVPPSPRPHNSLFGARVAAVVVALVYSVLAAAFAFGFIAVTTRAAAAGGGDIIFGLSPAQNVLARVPALIIVLASCATALTIVAWRRRWWKLTGQLVMTIVAISAIGFSTLLIHWGYFPTAI